MRKRTILLISILAISLIAMAAAQTNKINIANVKSCKTIEWETQENVYGTCTKEYTARICDDTPLNKSCHQEVKSYEYKCKKGTKTVPHSEKVCTTNAFQITKKDGDTIIEKGMINFKEWGKCSYEIKEKSIIINCDSKHDGNNDGICQSGESCVKFVVTKDDVKRYVKNSQDEFTIEDESFFLEKLDYEVMSE